MSSNKMPGEGKSGNWRSEDLSFTLRLESSAGLEVAEVVMWSLAASCWLLPAWGWKLVGLDEVVVGSGFEAGG